MTDENIPTTLSDLSEKNEFKKSYYNFLYSKEEKIYLFNTLRESFLEILPKEKSKYQWLGNEDTNIDLDTIDICEHWKRLDSKAKEHLLIGGFVIPSAFDEIEYLKFKNKIETSRTDYASITIALTYACNMKCVYCYENAPEKSGTISKETAQDILKYVENIIKKGCKCLDITWYGGEPLLRFELIISLSKEIIKLCDINNVKYSASIITNGALLTRERAIKLKEQRCGFAQITLDGTANVHNKRRPLKTGPSFDVIIANIKSVHDLMHISIRCNVDKSNDKTAFELIDYLENLKIKDSLSINFAPVTDKNIYQQKQCVSSSCNILYNYKTFSDIQAKLSDYALKRNLYRPSIPYKKFCACMADRTTSIVIEPNGNLVKCWEFIGNNDESVGNLSTGVILDSKALKWFNYSAFNYSFCKSCKLLPVCMGWCPAKIMNMKDESACNTIKYNIIKNLIRYCEFNSNITKGGEK